MSDNGTSKEMWQTEIFLAVALGLPWYLASASLVAAVVIHAGIVIVYFLLVIYAFGRGSAITSFVFLLIFSSLVVLVLCALHKRRLFSEERDSHRSAMELRAEQVSASGFIENSR
jgi:hypothetical protein